MLKRLRSLAVVLVGLFAAGLATRYLVEDRVWKQVRAEEPALRLESLDGAMGQGITLGLLGGFRALVANALWLRGAYAWEKNDLPQTQTMIKLTTTVDPRPLYFWQNGSRIIAYDIPSWRIEARGGYDVVPEAVQRQFDGEQAKVGLALLRKGLEFHPDDPLLYVEIANIYQRRLKDVATGAEYYKKAADQPNAPYYAARIYAELLRNLDRKQEAYDYLRQLMPTLPDDDAFAMKWVVYDRIRELEEELSIPQEKRYVGTRPGVVNN